MKQEPSSVQILVRMLISVSVVFGIEGM